IRRATMGAGVSASVVISESRSSVTPSDRSTSPWSKRSVHTPPRPASRTTVPVIRSSIRPPRSICSASASCRVWVLTRRTLPRGSGTSHAAAELGAQAALLLVHEVLRVRQDLGDSVRRRGVPPRHAAGDRQRAVALAARVQALEVLGEALVDDLAGPLAGTREHDGELVAAHARLHVGVAERLTEELRGLGERAGAGCAAEPLLDRVEHVDVE